MSGREVQELFLTRVLALQILIVGHVMLEYGVAGGILRRARCGIDSHLAVKHAEVLSPATGRLILGGTVRLPIAHDLRGDTTLQRQTAASYYFLFIFLFTCLGISVLFTSSWAGSKRNGAHRCGGKANGEHRPVGDVLFRARVSR